MVRDKPKLNFIKLWQYQYYFIFGNKILTRERMKITAEVKFIRSVKNVQNIVSLIQ